MNRIKEVNQIGIIKKALLTAGKLMFDTCILTRIDMFNYRISTECGQADLVINPSGKCKVLVAGYCDTTEYFRDRVYQLEIAQGRSTVAKHLERAYRDLYGV